METREINALVSFGTSYLGQDGPDPALVTNLSGLEKHSLFAAGWQGFFYIQCLGLRLFHLNVGPEDAAGGGRMEEACQLPASSHHFAKTSLRDPHLLQSVENAGEHQSFLMSVTLFILQLL